jgi:hypothetical protein
MIIAARAGAVSDRARTANVMKVIGKIETIGAIGGVDLAAADRWQQPWCDPSVVCGHVTPRPDRGRLA